MKVYSLLVINKSITELIEHSLMIYKSFELAKKEYDKLVANFKNSIPESDNDEYFDMEKIDEELKAAYYHFYKNNDQEVIISIKPNKVKS